MTNSFETLFNEQQWLFDKASFAKWDRAMRQCNDYEIEHAKRCLRYAMKHEITDTQLLYMIAYHINEMTMEEIGELYGVHKSTVSRCILRAEERLFKVLRYANPRFFSLEAPVHKRTKRKDDKRGHKRKQPAAPAVQAKQEAAPRCCALAEGAGDSCSYQGGKESQEAACKGGESYQAVTATAHGDVRVRPREECRVP